MDKVVLFDIDKTLFDRESFLNDFYNIFSSDLSVKQLSLMYEENKKKYGYFNSDGFVNFLTSRLPQHKFEADNFYKELNVNRYLWEDTDELFKIINYKIGVFSKGEYDFQRLKIKKFEKILDKDFIFIYKNKINHIQEVLKQIGDKKMYVVDDDLEILKGFKKKDDRVNTILIDRESKHIEKQIFVNFRLNSLFDIIHILK